MGTGANGSIEGYGFLAYGGSNITASGTGTLTLACTAGTGTDFHRGVYISDTGTALTTADGALSITGNGTGSGTNNFGIHLRNGAVVQTTGQGTLTLVGTGGSGSDSNLGVLLTDSGTAVMTAGGRSRSPATARGAAPWISASWSRTGRRLRPVPAPWGSGVKRPGTPRPSLSASSGSAAPSGRAAGASP
jgi:hypothetical protein